MGAKEMTYHERTVGEDLTVQVNGVKFGPEFPHARRLMGKWIGRRVVCWESNYEGTEVCCALNAYADVTQTATLKMVTT